MNTSDGYVCDNCGCDNPVMATATPEPDGSFFCEVCKARLRQPEAGRPIARGEALAISNETMCKAEEERQSQDCPVPASSPRVEEYAGILNGLTALREDYGLDKDCYIGKAIAAIRKLCTITDMDAYTINNLDKQLNRAEKQRDILAAALRTARKQISDALRGQTFCLDDLSKGGLMDAERTIDSALREAGMAEAGEVDDGPSD